MEINFYDQFGNYSTADLLRIIKEPEQYQLEAVTAAERILQERSISPADIAETDRYIQKVEAEKTARLKKLNFYKGKVAEIVEPILIPGTPLPPSRWFRLFIIAFGGIYVWTFYKFIKAQVHFLQCEGCRGDIFVWANLINISYLSIVFFLLLKKRRWGWILLVAGTASAIPTGIFQLYELYRFREIVRFDSYTIISAMIVPIAFLFFLWREPIAGFFGVDVKTKRLTTLIGAILGILYAGFVQLL